MGRFKIGLQLYSVRENMAEDMEGTIKKVAEMGYDCVEFAGYYDHTAEEVKAMCDKYGLEIPSVHQVHNVFLEDPEASVAYLKTLGVKYSAIPWVSAENWENNFGKLITEINQVSKILKDNGIQLLYHNHDFEFYSKHNDEYIFDAIFSEADTDSIYPELDTCWVHYSGNDPIAYIKKYGNVEEVLHLKDFECKNLAAGPVYVLIDDKGKTGETKGDRKGDGFEFRPTGSGRQNVPAILKAAEDTVIKYVIIEQDEHPTNTPLEDAKISIDYLRSIGY